MGRYTFQVNIIKSVNLNRGTILRIYKPNNTTIDAIINCKNIFLLTNITAVINPISQIFIYSARNNKVNL